ncbi:MULTISPECIES: DUF305 domain-containing protein [Kocuria]|uniref:DUF305 domain-containing protein n=1 Tax=Kocuria TaxID=57493 RepID=UPI00103920CC|nr:MULTISPECIES: DUF305 domain-containing protein [Kocuria]MCT2022226.1 DUF305 domain-containing protein [Kocuria marina]MDT0118987.1 DUF305 domain-containing protein [Kocuria sp. PD6]QBJ22478.1 DUF305 domain-containing protein [Kocuria indica]
MGSTPFRGRPTVAATIAVATALLGGATAPAFARWEATPVPAHTQTETLQPEPTSPTAYEFGETLAGLEGEELEITFLAEIIGHHQGAIEMAELELERGTSPDIRTHAENIVADQQHQIEQFTRWLDQWYGLTPDEAKAQAPEEARQEMATMEEEMQMMHEELLAVEAGEGFDVAFVQKMIPHHSSGIIEFLEPQARAPHAELRVASTAGITTQQAQVADFRTWLAGHG